jgi:preprotein translocase subunit SecD
LRAGGALAAVTLALLAACGGDATVTLSFRPEIAESTNDLNTGAILDATTGTIRNRAVAYGLEVPEIQVGADNTITVTTKGVDAQTAAQLLGAQASLVFKRPLLTKEGVVACATADGEAFGVLPENVNPDDSSGAPARCFSRDKVGDPVWAPAVALGTGEELTAESVQGNGWASRDDALVARFTPAGAATLEALTEEIAGYPLGIFLDDKLIAAPRVNRAITNGEAFIAGIDTETARLRAAQLNAGPLPVKLALVSSASPAA